MIGRRLTDFNLPIKLLHHLEDDDFLCSMQIPYLYYNRIIHLQSSKGSINFCFGFFFFFFFLQKLLFNANVIITYEGNKAWFCHPLTSS